MNASEENKGASEESLNQISQALQDNLPELDRMRAVALDGLQLLRTARAEGLRNEHERLSSRLGADHPRVAELAVRRADNEEFISGLAVEKERARVAVPAADKETWVLHGFVRDQQFRGVANVTVALFDDTGRWIQQLGFACTEKSGYFKLLHSRAKAGAADAAKEREAVKTAPGENVYIHVGDSQGAHLYVDKQPLTPELGRVDYREIILGEDEGICRPPESAPGPQPGKDEGRYLGNSGTRELHDLENRTPQCQIGEIRPDHRVSFKTEREAIAAGYDHCAYCFGKEKSTR